MPIGSGSPSCSTSRSRHGSWAASGDTEGELYRGSRLEAVLEALPERGAGAQRGGTRLRRRQPSARGMPNATVNGARTDGCVGLLAAAVCSPRRRRDRGAARLQPADKPPTGRGVDSAEITTLTRAESRGASFVEQGRRGAARDRSQPIAGGQRVSGGAVLDVHARSGIPRLPRARRCRRRPCPGGTRSELGHGDRVDRLRFTDDARLATASAST